MKSRTISTLLLLAFMTGCSTDLEINAPYKNITIVYGLLSLKTVDGADETTHLIKINKAFLGEGDAYVFAQIPDSNEYSGEQMSAKVEQWTNGAMVNEYPLLDTLIDDRVPGTFNYPVHKLYYFNAALDPNSDYKVVVMVGGETITAIAPIVNDFTISGPDQSTNVKINFILGSNYVPFELNWTSARDGKRYDASFRFNYDEVDFNGDTTSKSFTYRMGSEVTTTTNGSENLSAAIGGEDFYKTVASLVPVDANVSKRIFRGIDLLFEVAGQDFHTYLQLADPITGIVEERPEFTNVNGGYGLFSSRYFKQVIGKQLSTPSIIELAQGQYTGDRNFCSPDPGHNGEPYGCN